MSKVTSLPFISVIIPAYNEEKYLPHCLSALTNQTYPKNKYSITVVDNNSTDHTSAIAKKYGATVIQEKQQGHVFSLNSGLKQAKGDILAITDADSISSRNWLENIANAFEDPTIVGVTGALVPDFESYFLNIIFKYLHFIVQVFHFSFNKPTFYGPNMALRKSAFQKLKEVDTRYKVGGDAEIGIRLRKYGKVIFVKNLSVTTSSRRFSKGINIKDLYKFFIAYFYTIWLEKPPQGYLVPMR